LAGANTLSGLLRTGPQAAADCCETLTKIEKRAKAGARNTLDAIRVSFVTPFDRVDIKGLVAGINDCLRDMRRTARASTLLVAAAYDPDIRQIGGIVIDCAEHIARAMPLLPDIDRNVGQITEICRHVAERTEQSDDLIDHALTRLAGHEGRQDNDAVGLLMATAVYGRLEDVMDDFQVIGSAIHDVVIDQV